ncbi:MAG: lytic transglycosylase domain-containing protein [Novosphingobium sp.]
MSQVQSIGASGEVRSAIARAAQATGVDFNYLLGQAKLESSLDPKARAVTSSAAGLYQFVGSTWMDTLAKHGAQHGFGGMTDPARKASAMALRFDPDASALMAAELASDNKVALTTTLGREPDPAELYLAHFLGAEGAGRFLSGLASDPTQSAASLLPKAAAANRNVFFSPSGAPRSLGDVMGLLRGRLSSAMEGAGLPSSSGERIEGWGLSVSDRPHPSILSPEEEGLSQRGPLAREFHNSAATPVAPMQSMAETLNQTFSLGSPGTAVPDHVRTAYARLSALGL